MHLSPDMWGGAKVATVGPRPAHKRPGMGMLAKLTGPISPEAALVVTLAVASAGVGAAALKGAFAPAQELSAIVESGYVLPAHTGFVLAGTGHRSALISQSRPEQYVLQVKPENSSERLQVPVDATTFHLVTTAKPSERFVLHLQDGQWTGSIHMVPAAAPKVKP